MSETPTRRRRPVLDPTATDLDLPVAAAVGGCGCSPPLPNSSRPHANGACDAPATGHGRKRSPTRSVGSAPSRTQADRQQPGEDPGRRGCRRCRSPRTPTSSRATDRTVATGALPMRRAGRQLHDQLRGPPPRPPEEKTVQASRDHAGALASRLPCRPAADAIARARRPFEQTQQVELLEIFIPVTR